MNKFIPLKIGALLAGVFLMPVSSNAQSCNERSFPSLGPSASRSQTQSDLRNPINIGTLDARAMGAGGYSEGTFNGRRYGVYRLRGGPQRYDGTLTRVERSFNAVRRARNRSITLNALFVVVDASDRKTNLAQIHNNDSTIVAGRKRGQRALSALTSVGFEKTSNPDRFNIIVSETIDPFVPGSRGTRTDTTMRSITRGVEYRLAYTTGYDNRQVSFTRITITRANNPSDRRSMTLNHRFTTDRKGLRYGAYEAASSGDTGAEIRFRNVQLCRTN